MTPNAMNNKPTVIDGTGGGSSTNPDDRDCDRSKAEIPKISPGEGTSVVSLAGRSRRTVELGWTTGSVLCTGVGVASYFHSLIIFTGKYIDALPRMRIARMQISNNDSLRLRLDTLLSAINSTSAF